MATHTHIEHWQHFIKGDKAAFQALYDHFVDALFSYAIRFCADHDIIKDAIHDLFVDLHRYQSGLSPHVNVQAYLFRALRRKVVSYLEKKRTTLGLSTQEEIIFQLEYSPEEQSILDETENEILERLRYELDRLAARQKEALYLRFSSELPYEQVADIMGVSVSSCRTLVYRAVKQLRLRMEDVPVSLLLFMAFWQQP